MFARHRFILWSILLGLGLAVTACGTPSPVKPLLTPPAIGVQITNDFCPSIEVQAGMHIAWTNQDRVDRAILFERVNEQGEVTEAGGTDLLRPGDTFSTSFGEPGRYTYYCSEDRKFFGTITVLPISYPYP